MTAGSLLGRLAHQPQRLPAALLLSGPDPGALDRQATAMAARLLCPGDDPQLSCDSCRRVFAGIHPDLFRVDPQGLQIRIDRVRDALVFGAGRPYEAPHRVVIVSRAELLGPEGGNALLKSLEEPGKDLRWIVTTSRQEALLPTILSRCAIVPVAAVSLVERRGQWRARGFSAEDAEDLSRLEPEIEGAADALAAYRQSRSETVAALEAGLLGRRLVVLLLLADRIARAEGAHGRLLSELLGDAAISAAATTENLRHRAVAGITREIGQRLSGESLRGAALSAADPPADVRRGNRRFHFEKILLKLFFEG